MWVILPHTAHSPPHEVTTALDATGWDYAPISVAASDRAYFDVLSSLWSDGAEFCIVEHDVVVHPTALDELADCSHNWCGFPHEYGGKVVHGMGCVKFGADLMARNPDAMIRVGVMSDANHPKRHWCRLDAYLQQVVLPNAGEKKHEHDTVVGHLGRGCSHGCTALF